MNEITINGKTYQKKEQPKPSKSSSKLLMMAAAMGGMAAAMGSYGQSYSKERPQVKLEEEFELIQNKQSTLSRSDREWVVATFNRLYKEVGQQ